MEEESKAPELSPPRKFEKSFDELVDLIQRRPKVGLTFVAILAVCVIIPGLWGAWEKWKTVPELNAKLDKATEKVSKLTKDLETATGERDKAEIKLAPFWAAADARFTNAPPDKRLDLLIESMNKVLERLPKTRELSSEDISSIKEAFRTVDKSITIITASASQSKAVNNLAWQISEAFREMNFTVQGPNTIMAFSTRLPRLAVYVSPDLRITNGAPGVGLKFGLVDAISTLMTKCGEKVELTPYSNNNRPNSIEITVAE